MFRILESVAVIELSKDPKKFNKERNKHAPQTSANMQSEIIDTSSTKQKSEAVQSLGSSEEEKQSSSLNN